MPNVILKKTFHVKPSGFQTSQETSLSFHGALTPTVIDAINQKLSSLRLFGKAAHLIFKCDDTGHYSGLMNDDFAKYHEEDCIVSILDVMEVLGWTFRFRYGSESSKAKAGSGNSHTSREVFLFHKDPPG